MEKNAKHKDAFETIKPVDAPLNVGEIVGGATGEEEEQNAAVAGGWAGTDDATSTATSDLPEEMQPHLSGEEGVDPSGRAAGGDLNGAEGGIADLAGGPVESTRDWVHSPTDETLDPEKR